MRSVKFLIFFLVFFAGYVTIGISQTKSDSLNPGLSIDDAIVKNLDGAYCVIIVDDNGHTQQFNAKFNNGRITSIVIDGEPLPQKEWKDNVNLISEFVDYLSTSKQKVYKYQNVYELEAELKRDIDKLEKVIKDLELSRRFERFYNEELKDWMVNLEQELNNSGMINEIEQVLNELNEELDQFLNERRSYTEENIKKEGKIKDQAGHTSSEERKPKN
ncbi:MAG: hypothetical protein U9N86_00905 [Bacteroidota bacterium]|nr:hypothetical protein [Bacteroidota bacterium]